MSATEDEYDAFYHAKKIRKQSYDCALMSEKIFTVMVIKDEFLPLLGLGATDKFVHHNQI